MSLILIICNFNSALTFSFAKFCIIYFAPGVVILYLHFVLSSFAWSIFLLGFAYRCNLVRTFEENTDSLLKAQSFVAMIYFQNKSFLLLYFSIHVFPIDFLASVMSSLSSDLFICVNISLKSFIWSKWHASNITTGENETKKSASTTTTKISKQDEEKNAKTQIIKPKILNLSSKTLSKYQTNILLQGLNLHPNLSANKKNFVNCMSQASSLGRLLCRSKFVSQHKNHEVKNWRKIVSDGFIFKRIFISI